MQTCVHKNVPSDKHLIGINFMDWIQAFYWTPHSINVRSVVDDFCTFFIDTVYLCGIRAL